MAEAVAATAAAPRRWRALGHLGLRTIIVLALLVLAVLAADRSGLGIDLSADKRFTLQARLVSLAQQQQQPVQLVAIWNDEIASDPSSPWLQGECEALAETARRVAALNAQISFQQLDPAIDRPLLEQFAKDHGEAAAPALYVVRPGAGARAFKIPVFPGLRYAAQRQIGAGLAQLDQTERIPVWILHGQGAPGLGGGEHDLTQFAADLSLSGYAPRTITEADLARLGGLRGGVLCIIGPSAPLGPTWLAAIDQHWRDGQPLLIAGDDQLSDDLCRWLRTRGVLIGTGYPQGLEQGSTAGLFDVNAPGMPSDVIRSTVGVLSDARGDLTRLLLRHAGGDDAGSPADQIPLGPAQQRVGISMRTVASDRAIYSSRSTPVRVVSDGDVLLSQTPDWQQRYAALGTPRFAGTELLRVSTPPAWAAPMGRTATLPDFSSMRESLPMRLCWAVEYDRHADSVTTSRGARMLVWGSAQALGSLPMQQTQLGNSLFALDAVAWLADRPAPAELVDLQLASYQVSTNAVGIVLALLVALLPCLFIGVAILRWIDRR